MYGYTKIIREKQRLFLARNRKRCPRANLNFNEIVPTMATVNETARIFGLAKHFVRRLALEGKIKHVRAGKKILINLELLRNYLYECPSDNSENRISNKFGISKVEGGHNE